MTYRQELRKLGLSMNESEMAAQLSLKKCGIEYTRRGYPDLTLMRGGEIIGFVEVKPNHRKAMKPEQMMFERFCLKHGVPFLKWTPEDGEAGMNRLIRQLN